jgi:hypothetical protein
MPLVIVAGEQETVMRFALVALVQGRHADPVAAVPHRSADGVEGIGFVADGGVCVQITQIGDLLERFVLILDDAG